MNNGNLPPLSADNWHLRALLESTDDFILICDGAGKPVLFNDAYARIMKEALGIEMKPGLQPHTLLPDPEQVAWWESLHRRVLGGERFRVDFALATGDGPPRHFEFSYNPIVINGAVSGFCEISRDITLRKVTEERYRLLLEGTAAVPWEADLESGRFTYIGPQVASILGYPVESWTDLESWGARVHPEDRELAVEFARECAAGGEDHAHDFRMIASDGRVVWIRDVVKVVSEGKKPVALRGFLLDISELKSMEQENSRNRNIHSLGALAGGIAHDFNNLLTAVFGNIELAGLHETDAAAAALLGKAMEGVERTRHLTQQLLSFSMGGVPRKERISIDRILVDAATFALTGSRHRLTTDIQRGLLPVEVEKGQLERVVQNLVLNARDAMAIPGTIELVARNVEEEESTRVGMKGRRCVCFTVRDRGVGIPAGNLERVFDPYFTTKGMGDQPGTGLGLAVCHTIVTRHGGRIRVESEEGRGTAFNVYLSAAASPARSEGLRDREGGGIPRREARVLVMDDDESVVDVLKGMLLQMGYSVRVAMDGWEAFEIYKAAMQSGAPFDAAILDLTVRGKLGGVETLALLKSVDPAVRAVVGSGYSDDPVIAMHESYGFMAALTKPYRLGELRKAMDIVLGAG